MCKVKRRNPLWRHEEACCVILSSLKKVLSSSEKVFGCACSLNFEDLIILSTCDTTALLDSGMGRVSMIYLIVLMISDDNDVSVTTRAHRPFLLEGHICVFDYGYSHLRCSNITL